MAVISKPMNGAFVLNKHKVSDFLQRRVNTSADAINRIEKRKKAGEVASSEK